MTDGPTWPQCVDARRLCQQDIYKKMDEHHGEAMGVLHEIETKLAYQNGKANGTASHAPVPGSWVFRAVKQGVTQFIINIIILALVGGLAYALFGGTLNGKAHAEPAPGKGVDVIGKP